MIRPKKVLQVFLQNLFQIDNLFLSRYIVIDIQLYAIAE